MSLPASESLFYEDLEEAPGGAGVRPSGYIAFALGLFSIMALLGGAWYILPLSAICVALFALRPVPEGVDRPAGRGWAIAGLSIALFFAAWGGTTQTLRRVAMLDDAEQFTRNWLAILGDGHEEFAFELTQNYAARQIAGIDLERFYRENSEAGEHLQRFMSDSATQQILQAGDKPRWEVQGSPIITKRFHLETIRMVMADATGTIQRPVEVTLHRVRDHETGVAQWSVNGVMLTDAEERSF